MIWGDCASEAVEFYSQMPFNSAVCKRSWSLSYTEQFSVSGWKLCAKIYCVLYFCVKYKQIYSKGSMRLPLKYVRRGFCKFDMKSTPLYIKICGNGHITWPYTHPTKLISIVVKIMMAVSKALIKTFYISSREYHNKWNQYLATWLSIFTRLHEKCNALCNRLWRH